jgi:adenylate kinase family enzyme
MKSIIAITGPAGAGKSTVSIRLARQIERSTHIDADNVKHMIESGFTHTLAKDGSKKWKYTEWELVGEGVGLLAKLFYDTDHTVIINGYLDESCWPIIEKHIKIDRKILLLPQLDTVVHRDTLRNEGYQMGKAAVTEHHAHFSSAEVYKDFEKLDTTDQTADETVELIINRFLTV